MRTRRGLIGCVCVPATLFLAAVQVPAFEYEYWKGRIGVGLEPRAACTGLEPALQWALTYVTFVYGEDSDMSLDEDGLPARGQFDPDTDEAKINYTHAGHWTAEGEWSDDAKVTVAHEAVHAVAHLNPRQWPLVTILDGMGEGQLDEQLRACYGMTR